MTAEREASHEAAVATTTAAHVSLDDKAFPTAAVFGIAIVLAVLVLALPVLATLAGGYAWVDGLFYRSRVPVAAITGTRLSNGLLILGVLGLLAGLIWPRLALWVGLATRLRVLAWYGAVIALGVACRVETIALMKSMHAREDQAVRTLYEKAAPSMSVASVQALAATLNPDIETRYSTLANYDRILEVERARYAECVIELSAPERYAGTRLVAEVSRCGVHADADTRRLYLVERKHQVAAK
ncbi:hypothetical protein PY254_06230 [Rhodanobacter sp. AS-Z3]|uniref:hypothetical protein n=1 Tax=Rhodanobacter sp. AS-Z3 TaxID=3031330 RepID=UPI00247B0DB5|nr:hypothetical protein [Rhodanobacter sp. AS-Z3]WEN16262.1 hypothetical protein PY254_06230 [Rhodanobacter sp. AS-Z3]